MRGGGRDDGVGLRGDRGHADDSVECLLLRHAVCELQAVSTAAATITAASAGNLRNTDPIFKILPP